MRPPKDRNGNVVRVGDRVRLVCLLPGNWLEELPHEEKRDVMSMIGEVFVVEEIDELGSPWIRKLSHSIALASDEMELVP